MNKKVILGFTVILFITMVKAIKNLTSFEIINQNNSILIKILTLLNCILKTSQVQEMKNVEFIIRGCKNAKFSMRNHHNRKTLKFRN